MEEALYHCGARMHVYRTQTIEEGGAFYRRRYWICKVCECVGKTVELEIIDSRPAFSEYRRH